MSAADQSIEDVLTELAAAGYSSGFSFRNTDRNVAVVGEGQRWLASVANSADTIDAHGSTLLAAFQDVLAKATTEVPA